MPLSDTSGVRSARRSHESGIAATPSAPLGGAPRLHGVAYRRALEFRSLNDRVDSDRPIPQRAVDDRDRRVGLGDVRWSAALGSLVGQGEPPSACSRVLVPRYQAWAMVARPDAEPDQRTRARRSRPSRAPPPAVQRGRLAHGWTTGRAPTWRSSIPDPRQRFGSCSVRLAPRSKATGELR